MSITPVYVQAAFRGRNDNGSETTATWKGTAADNENWTQLVDTNFRVRFCSDETAGGATNNKTYQLQYSTDGTNYNNVNGTNSLVVRSSASPNVADAAACTHQLTFSSGTFSGGNGFDEADGIAGGANMDDTASGYSEVEYCVQIRSADVTDGQTVYLRLSTANMATWNQVPAITVSKPARIVQPAADPLGGYSDSPPTIDLQELVQLTPKNYPLDADPWENLADYASTEYLFYAADSVTYDRQEVSELTPKNYPLTADPWANLADTPPVIFRTGKIEIALAADPWANLGDSPPTIVVTGKREIALSADPLGNLADQPPNVLRTGTLVVAPTADPMTMGDQPPIVIRTGKIAVTLAADPWENLADISPFLIGDHQVTFSEDILNLADMTPTVDRQEISTTPKNYPLTADPWANLADAPPTVDRRGSLITALSPDSLNNWTDQPPTIAMTGKRELALPADPLSMADQPPSVAMTAAYRFVLTGDSMTLLDAAPALIGDHLVTFSEDILNLADTTPTVDQQVISSTPKTATPPADANAAYADSISGRGYGYVLPDSMTLADATPTVAMTGKITLTLAADPMTMGDVVPTVAMTGRIEFALTGDALIFGDLTPVVASGGDLRYALTADNLANYADTFSQSESYRLAADDLRNYDDEIDNLVLAKRYSLSADPWANLGDSPPTVSKPGSLTVTPPANAMTMADAPPTIIKTALKSPSLPADAMPVYGERLGVALGFVDPWQTLNDAMRLGWAFRLSGDAMSMVDQMQLAAGGDLPLSLPADPMTLADEAAVTYGKSYAPSADAMSMSDQPVAYAAGILLELTDDLDDWQDSRETVEGLAPQLADDLNEYLDEMRIRGIIPAEIIRLSGKLNTSVGLSGKVIDKVGLSGHINGNRIGISGKLYEGG